MNKHEPKPKGLATCPDWLSDVARAEWERVFAQLKPLRMATSIDTVVLAIYCDAYARLREANEQCKVQGDVVAGTRGTPVMNPWRTVAQRAEETILRIASEFGMTPSARARISIAPELQSDNESSDENETKEQRGNPAKYFTRKRPDDEILQ